MTWMATASLAPATSNVPAPSCRTPRRLRIGRAGWTAAALLACLAAPSCTSTAGVAKGGEPSAETAGQEQAAPDLQIILLDPSGAEVDRFTDEDVAAARAWRTDDGVPGALLTLTPEASARLLERTSAQLGELQVVMIWKGRELSSRPVIAGPLDWLAVIERAPERSQQVCDEVVARFGSG